MTGAEWPPSKIHGGAAHSEVEPTIDPQTACYLERERPRWEGLPIDAARQLSKEWIMKHQAYALDGVTERAAITAEEVELDVPGGHIPLRLYRPAVPTAVLLPVVVLFHGGGWVIGDLDTHEELCRELARRVPALVASVGYRLAPEHRYPHAVQDCLVAIDWVATHALRFGGDVTRIAVAGDSAGGNLATVVARWSRDGVAPALLAQVLIYPVVDNTSALDRTSSARRFGEGFELTLEGFHWFQDQYFGSESWRRAEPDASPLLAEDLRGMAPALLVVADLDPIADSVVEYEQRLAVAGVPTKLVRYEGVMHAFVTMGAVFDAALSAVDEVVAALVKAFDAGGIDWTRGG